MGRSDRLGRAASVHRTLRWPPALAFGLLLFFFIPATAQAQQAVDVELVLAVDCSYSVDADEYALQMQGLAAAFRDPLVLAAIHSNPNGAIAVTVVQWSGPASQAVAVPWRRVGDKSSALDFSARVAAAPRLTADGATAMAAAVEFGLRLFAGNGYAGTRRVIDVSADGRNNSGPHTRAIRPLVAGNGVTLNGLAILNEVATLNYYFEKYVIVGADAFVEKANDYRAYRKAILKKLLREIGLPATS